MKFAIATVAFWEALGYDTANWRKSNDGNQAITELKYAEILGVNLRENPEVKIYFGDNPELIRLLESAEWHRDGTNGPFDSYNLLEQLAEVDTRLTTAMANVTELVVDAEETLTEFDVALEAGVVATNIENKLNNLETTYAPRLTATEQQLAEAEQQINLITNGLGENYATLAALQAAYPTGHTKDHLVLADGHRYFWSGSAWVDGGIYQAIEYDGFPATNKIVNGNFANGTNSWALSGATLSVTNNILSVVGSGAYASTQAVQTTQQVANTGHKLHIKFKVTVKNSNVTSIGCHLIGTTGSKYNVKTVATPALDSVNQFDFIYTTDGTMTGNYKLVIFASYATAEIALGKEIQVEKVFLHDVTETFDSGEEPALEILTEMMGEHTGWFDGTVGSFLSTKGIYDYFKTRAVPTPIPDSSTTFTDPDTLIVYRYWFSVDAQGNVSINYEEVI